MIYYKVKQIQAKDYIVETPAVSSALSLDEVKEHLKITDDDRNDYLFSLIKVVTDQAEQITGRDLMNKTYKGFLDCFPACSTRSIQIRRSKLQSITSIQYYVDTVLTTFDANKYYITETGNGFSTMNLFEDESWPTGVDKRRQAIVITFVAGYGTDSCDIPAGLRQAMLSSIAMLYDDAGDCGEGTALNAQAKMLYQPYVLSTKQVCVF
jgi:uncharacterized phiE125 gp8 family phage protein